MSDYRIKIVRQHNTDYYYPQRRFLKVFWKNILVECGGMYNLYYSTSKEKAIAVIENDKKQREKHIREVMYEYLD